MLMPAVPSREEKEYAARQAYIMRCLGKPGRLGFRRLSATSAKVAPLLCPLLRESVVEEGSDRLMWSKSPPVRRSPSVSGDCVMLPAESKHTSVECTRSCGKPCERPPQAHERGAQETVAVKLRSSPLSMPAHVRILLASAIRAGKDPPTRQQVANMRAGSPLVS